MRPFLSYNYPLAYYDLMNWLCHYIQMGGNGEKKQACIDSNDGDRISVTAENSMATFMLPVGQMRRKGYSLHIRIDKRLELSP